MNDYPNREITHSSHLPWNKGRLVGQKMPLKPSEIWAIRVRLQLLNRIRDLALFNLAIDSKLRGCDLVRLRIGDVIQGGKVNLVGISKRVANRRLRAVLIQGARAYVYKMNAPRTTKDRWLWAIIERSGHRRAAVALANKNGRTAWAMLTQNTSYQCYPLAA